MAILKVKVDYPTIQSAVDAATPGDCILVESGVYHEQVTVSTSHLHIIGENGAMLDGQAELESAFVLYKVSGVTIEKFKITDYKFDAISIMNGDFTIIAQNNIFNCGEAGVNLYEAPNTSITGNTICRMGNYGVFNDRSSNVRIERNTIIGNGRTGIFIAAVEANSDIVDNRLIKNKQHGIVNYGRDSRIVSNTLCGNNDGVYVLSRTLLESNDVKSNREDGIQIFGNSSTIRDNTVSANGDYGIFINYVGGYHTIVGNRVVQNKGRGLFVGAGQNVVVGNRAEDNSVYDMVLAQSDNVVKNNCCTACSPLGLCEPCKSMDGENMERMKISDQDIQHENLAIQKKKLEALKAADSLPIIIENQVAVIEDMEKQLNKFQISDDYIRMLLERYPAENG